MASSCAQRDNECNVEGERHGQYLLAENLACCGEEKAVEMNRHRGGAGRKEIDIGTRRPWARNRRARRALSVGMHGWAGRGAAAMTVPVAAGKAHDRRRNNRRRPRVFTHLETPMPRRMASMYLGERSAPTWRNQHRFAGAGRRLRAPGSVRKRSRGGMLRVLSLSHLEKLSAPSAKRHRLARLLRVARKPMLCARIYVLGAVFHALVYMKALSKKSVPTRLKYAGIRQNVLSKTRPRLQCAAKTSSLQRKWQ